LEEEKAMAHNPLNDLYVDSVEEVSKDTQPYWEIASAICNRDLRRHQSEIAQRLQKKHHHAHVKEEPHAQNASRSPHEAKA
jgi:hypothetical protein